MSGLPLPGLSQEPSVTWLSTNWFRTIRSTSPQYSGWPLLASVTARPKEVHQGAGLAGDDVAFAADDLGQKAEPRALRADVAVEGVDPAEEHRVFHVEGVVGGARPASAGCRACGRRGGTCCRA